MVISARCNGETLTPSTLEGDIHPEHKRYSLRVKQHKSMENEGKLGCEVKSRHSTYVNQFDFIATEMGEAAGNAIPLPFGQQCEQT